MTKRIVIDLDNTICTPNLECGFTHGRYTQATPIWPMINWMYEQKAEGAYLIIHTARRMVTHNGNVAAVIADVGPITVDWLTRHRVPYDELVFGKPYGDVYIDDKALNTNDKSFSFNTSSCLDHPGSWSWSSVPGIGQELSEVHSPSAGSADHRADDQGIDGFRCL